MLGNSRKRYFFSKVFSYISDDFIGKITLRSLINIGKYKFRKIRLNIRDKSELMRI